jgi:hypothetical protein
VAERLTDDFVVVEADGLPMAGTYRGVQGLQDLFTKVMGLMDVVAMDRVETTAGKDHAVTILSLRFADPRASRPSCASCSASATARPARSFPITSIPPRCWPQPLPSAPRWPDPTGSIRP